MTICEMLHERKIYTGKDFYLTVNKVENDLLYYTYLDGDYMSNNIFKFLSYHGKHIRNQHPDIVHAYPEYFI